MRALSSVPSLERHRRLIPLGVFFLLTAVIAACSSDIGSDGLSPSSLLRVAGDTTERPPRDSTPRDTAPRDTTPRDTTPRDTTPRDTTQKPPRDTLDTLPPLPEKVTLSGRVLAVTVIVPAPGVRDTLRFEPIPGVRVRVVRNVLVDGRATQVPVAELVSDANGAFGMKDLPGGYYVLYAEPPAGSPFTKSHSFLHANRPRVTVDIYLWRRASDG